MNFSNNISLCVCNCPLVGGNWEEQHEKLACQLENLKYEFEDEPVLQRTSSESECHKGLFGEGTNHGIDGLGDSGYHAADKYRSQEVILQFSKYRSLGYFCSGFISIQSVQKVMRVLMCKIKNSEKMRNSEKMG